MLFFFDVPHDWRIITRSPNQIWCHAHQSNLDRHVVIRIEMYSWLYISGTICFLNMQIPLKSYRLSLIFPPFRYLKRIIESLQSRPYVNIWVIHWIKSVRWFMLVLLHLHISYCHIIKLGLKFCNSIQYCIFLRCFRLLFDSYWLPARFILFQHNSLCVVFCVFVTLLPTYLLKPNHFYEILNPFPLAQKVCHNKHKCVACAMKTHFNDLEIQHTSFTTK